MGFGNAVEGCSGSVRVAEVVKIVLPIISLPISANHFSGNADGRCQMHGQPYAEDRDDEREEVVSRPSTSEHVLRHADV